MNSETSIYFDYVYKQAMHEHHKCVTYEPSKQLSFHGEIFGSPFGMKLVQLGSFLGLGIKGLRDSKSFRTELRRFERKCLLTGAYRLRIISITPMSFLEKLGYSPIERYTMRINLSLGEKLFMNLQGRCRTAVRKANKLGIESWISNRYEDFASFYDLYNETMKKTNASYFTKAFLSDVLGHWLPKGKAFLCFSGMPDDLPNSTAAIIILGDSVYYWLGGTSKKRRTNNASNLLHWKIIEWAQTKGLSWYDLNGLTLEENRPTSSVSKFKMSFNGDIIRIHAYEKILGRIRNSTFSLAKHLLRS